jgi:Protein of unknown function (DUF2934)
MDKSLENRIRERAYDMWTAQGCVHGQAEHHWLAAEREVLATSTTALAREPVPKKKRPSPGRSKIARARAGRLTLRITSEMPMARLRLPAVGDPTADISNSRKIHAVWHRGKQAAGPIETFTP